VTNHSSLPPRCGLPLLILSSVPDPLPTPAHSRNRVPPGGHAVIIPISICPRRVAASSYTESATMPSTWENIRVTGTMALRGGLLLSPIIASYQVRLITHSAHICSPDSRLTCYPHRARH
jgi:hypothetical protein